MDTETKKFKVVVEGIGQTFIDDKDVAGTCFQNYVNLSKNGNNPKIKNKSIYLINNYWHEVIDYYKPETVTA